MRLPSAPDRSAPPIRRGRSFHHRADVLQSGFENFDTVFASLFGDHINGVVDMAGNDAFLAVEHNAVDHHLKVHVVKAHIR